MKLSGRTSRWRLFAFFAIGTLIVPLLGFLLLGEAFERFVADAVRSIDSVPALWLAVVGALASDLFLPIPSSVVLTFAGAEMGIVAAALAGTIGLTVSAEMGYWLGRVGGRSLGARFASDADLDALENRASATSLWWLIVSRPLPLIAEAATVGAGIAGISHRRFLAVAIVANAWVAIVFAALGSWGGERYQWITLAASAIVPLLLTAALRRQRSMAGVDHQC